jgi:ribosomal protein S7
MRYDLPNSTDREHILALLVIASFCKKRNKLQMWNEMMNELLEIADRLDK